jgi:predicted RND superfamily exporter protein
MSNPIPALETARSRVFLPFAQWIIAHRKLVIFGVLATTGVLASNLGRLEVDSNPKLWAPQRHPYVLTTDVLDSVFGGRNLTVIGVVPKRGDIYQPAVLAKIRRLQDSLELLPNAIRHNVLSLAARKVKLVKGGADGMEVTPMLDTVPTTPEGIARLRAAVASMPVYINALVSPDGRAAAVVADFKQDSTTPNYIALNAGLRRIIEQERDDSVDLLLGGLPIVGEAADREFMKMPLFFGAALLIVMLVQFWSFRSVQGMLLPMVTGILSVLWSLGLMGLLGVHLDPLNTTTPILVLAVAAGHAIQILKRYYEEYGRLTSAGIDAREANERAVIESIVRVGPVMVVAGLIAVITFASLVGTGIPMVQHFGVFAACGVLATMVIELTVIPALRSMLRPPKARETAREARVGGRARLVVSAGLAVLLAIGAGVFRLRIDNNFKLYFSPESEMRVHDRVLNAAFGGTNSIQFLVQTPARDGLKDPRVLHGMDRLQRFLETQRDVGKTQSLVDLIKQMNQAMHADDPKYYAVPETRELVSQYLFLYGLSGDPQDFDSFVDHDFQRASVWAFIKNESTSYADSLARRAQGIIAESFPPGVTVQMGGSVPQIMALNEVIVSDKFRNMAQMSLVVFVLGAIIMRSLVGGLFVVTPLFAVMLANFGVMGWFDTPLDVTAMTTAAMAIGIGADYEIYLLFRFREELRRTGSVLEATRTSMLTSGKAILLVAISVASGYAVLQASDFQFYKTLSTLVGLTMGISAFFALFFLRALMMVFRPRFVFGDERDALFAAAAKPATPSPAIGGAP